MRRIYLPSLSLIIALVFLLGCAQTTQVKEENENDNNMLSSLDLDRLTTPADVTETSAIEENGVDRRPAQASDLPDDDEPEIEESDDDSLDEATNEYGLNKQQREEAFKSFLRRAREHKAKGAYDQAEIALKSALDLKPTDQEANEMLSEILALKGRAKGAAYRNLKSATDEEQSKINEGIAEVRLILQKAKRLFNERNYNDCIILCSDGLEIAKWFRGRMDLAGEEGKLKTLLKQAEEANEKQRQYDLEILKETTEQMREVERRNRINKYNEEMRILMEAAKDQFNREQYIECIITLEKILWKDPYNTEAAKLIEYTRTIKYQRRDRNLRDKLSRMWETTMISIEESADPFVGEQYEADPPSIERWREIEIRKRQVIARQTRGIDPAILRIKETLQQKKVNVDYNEEELTSVLDKWSKATGLNFNRSKTVISDFDELLVTIKNLGIMSIADALNVVIRKGLAEDLDYYIENGMIIISTQEEAKGRGTIRRIFNVKDLLGGYRMFPGEEIKIDRSNSSANADEEVEEPIEIEFDELPDALIQATGGDEIWDEDNTRLTTGPSGTLIAVNTPEVLAEVERLLDDLRQSRGLMVTIECRFIKIEDNFLEEVGIDYRGAGGVPPGAVGPNLTAAPLDDFMYGLTTASLQGENYILGRDTSAGIYWSNAPDSEVRSRIENMFDQSLGDPDIMTNTGGSSFQLAYLDDVQINAILRATKKREKVVLVTAPKITCFNTQRANITIRNQVAFIEDFNVEARQNVSIADPVVGTIEDGLVLDMRPVISSDRRYITVEMRPTIALLQRPMDTLTTTLGGAGSTPVTIQLPEINVQRIRTTVIVPDGGAFILGGLKMKSEIAQDSGVPMLSDVPILGNLFSRKGRSNLRSELVIMIKARITDLRELADLTSPTNLGSDSFDYASSE